MVHAQRILQMQVHDETVKDVQRGTEAESGGWTFDTIGRFLARLSQEGRRDQEQPIRIAALRGGFIKREIVAMLVTGGTGADEQWIHRRENLVVCGPSARSAQSLIGGLRC